MKTFAIIPYTLYCDNFDEIITVRAKYQMIPHGMPNGKFCNIKCPHSWKCEFSKTGKCSIASKIPDVREI